MNKLLITCAIVLFVAGSATADNYGVLFAGGWNWYNNHDRYYDQTLRMYNIMTGTLGYSADNVYVLFADGTDPAIDRSSNVSSDWSMIPTGHIEAGTYTNLQNRLGMLQQTLTEEDCFHFWAYDHGDNATYTVPGTATHNEGALCAWNETLIRDDEFAAWVNPFDLKAESYMFANCFAGDMVDDLNILPGENRFAAYSADWYEVSHSGSTAGFSYEWANAIVSGLRNTYDLYNYAELWDVYGPNGSGIDHPGWIGANFDIVTNVPAPAALLMGILGLGTAGMRLRRKKVA